MKESVFKREMIKCKTLMNTDDRQEYYSGFTRGLRRRYHGDEFGTLEEHQNWINFDRDERGEGYRNGFYGPVNWDDLPNAIRILRDWHELTVTEFGELCARSGRTIENWEQGRTKVPDAAVKMLHKIYLKNDRTEKLSAQTHETDRRVVQLETLVEIAKNNQIQD